MPIRIKTAKDEVEDFRQVLTNSGLFWRIGDFQYYYDCLNYCRWPYTQVFQGDDLPRSTGHGVEAFFLGTGVNPYHLLQYVPISIESEGFFEDAGITTNALCIFSRFTTHAKIHFLKADPAIFWEVREAMMAILST